MNQQASVFGCLPEVMDLSFPAFAKAFESPKQLAAPAVAGPAKPAK